MSLFLMEGGRKVLFTQTTSASVPHTTNPAPLYRTPPLITTLSSPPLHCVQFMGLLNTFASVLAWAGPILFILFNEILDINYAVLSLSVFYLIAACILCTVNMDDAHEVVRQTSGARRKSVAMMPGAMHGLHPEDDKLVVEVSGGGNGPANPQA